MTLAFLCVIGLLGAAEAAGQFTSWHDRLTDALAIVACIVIGLWSLRRYLYLLNHAEFVANQADCPGCGTYGRLELVHEPASGDATPVRCRTCTHHWLISD